MLNINEIPGLEFVGKGNYRTQSVIIRRVVPKSKILTALKFYARGSYQGSVGQNMYGPMAQQTVSRRLQKVTIALNAPHILRKNIKFLQNRSERNLISDDFMTNMGFLAWWGASIALI